MANSEKDPVKQKIFTGAQAALVQYSLSKLTMSDIYRAAGISRATLYRYFASRDELLKELRQWEMRSFLESMSKAVEDAQPEDRLKILLENLTALPQNYPSLIPLLENDPGYVLSSLKTLYPAIQDQIKRLLIPIVARDENSAGDDLKADQLIDCFLRIAVTIYLFPDPVPGTTEKSLLKLYELWRQNKL